ncbi:adenylyltransferase/cytidyltransferase family protein [Ilumatobacter sp.]|uniref:adenylyltransferase/cytidyltransferase family protein n=1 Tax=Ilumatobacter sp. TaxID=1967498 RepID=UPI003C52DC47
MNSTDRHRTGLIVGRFDPPHLGHSHMIDWADERTDRLVVYVNSSFARDTVPGELRAAWLAEAHPNVEVRVVRHSLATDWDDEDLWARWIELFRSHWPHESGPDAVFSSDAYVSGIASRLDAVAVTVDPDRVTVPVTATQIRDEPAAHLDKVTPPVRQWIESNWL